MEMTLSALVTYSSSHRISLGICLCKFSTRIPPRQFNFSPRVETIPTEPFFSNLTNSRASARHCLLSFNTNCTALFPANSPQCHAFVRCCPEIHSRKGWTIYFNKAIKGNYDWQHLQYSQSDLTLVWIPFLLLLLLLFSNDEPPPNGETMRRIHLCIDSQLISLAKLNCSAKFN